MPNLSRSCLVEDHLCLLDLDCCQLPLLSPSIPPSLAFALDFAFGYSVVLNSLRKHMHSLDQTPEGKIDHSSSEVTSGAEI